VVRTEGQAVLICKGVVQSDWRPVLSRITIPCLVLGGSKSSVFPEEGVKAVADLLPTAHYVGHLSHLAM
jgi:pimeloyl-ACP methyl ester carboxylesterase